jgi:adenine-specific DNA-methyltransferase
MIKSENWQGLNLLVARYNEGVKSIYIDPPYNTGKDEFIYRDVYQHTSWLTMMAERVSLSTVLLVSGNPLLISVDEVEQARLEVLLQELFGMANYLTTYVWEGGRKNDSRLVSISNEYILCFVKNLEQLISQGAKWLIRKRGIDDIYGKAQSLKREFRDDYEQISQKLKEWLYGLPDNHPAKRHKHYWAVDGRGVYFPSDIGWHGGDGPKYEVIHPITGKPCKVPERGWMYPTQERMYEAISQGLVHFWVDHTRVPCGKAYLKDNEFMTPNSVFYRDRRGPSKRLRRLFGRSPSGRDFFENPKDENMLAELFDQCLTQEGVVLDFFAGSGTTAHAVMSLNQDGGRRKFILIEMANYFYTVMIPRIKKVAYSFNWKDVKPKDSDGNGIFFKYQVLEQYEDTLDNLELKENQEALSLFGNDYLLKYFLDFESRDNAALVNFEHFKKPFSYKLKVNPEEVGEPEEAIVDLPETFHYLLGLKIKKIKVRNDRGRKYFFSLGEKGGRNVAVVWREYDDDWSKPAFQKDKEFIIREIQGWAPQVVYVNGQSTLTQKIGSFTAEVRPIEPEFRKRMVDAS